VKHSPIQELPAIARALFQDTVDIRVDNLRREDSGKIGGFICRTVVDPDAGEIPAFFNPHRRRLPATRANSPEHGQAGLIPLDHVLNRVAAKGTGQGEQVDRLQQAGLATGVLAIDQVDLITGSHGDRVQVTDPADLQVDQTHVADIKVASA